MKYLFLLALLMLAVTGCCPDKSTSEFHKYDINQDGAVTPIDVLLITNYLNEQKTNE